jgi:hypothetical protein
MTAGQKRALLELRRFATTNPNVFELVHEPCAVGEWLVSTVAITIGPISSRPGGLDLREREEFIIKIPSGFPFDRPSVLVDHKRFAGFNHVIWGKHICLFQSNLEWNPSDGLFGFFDRLLVWIRKAALNDMDPIGGPLEPPHHVTSYKYPPFVIRASAPCLAGESWIGFAILEKHLNRTELVGWNDLWAEVSPECDVAFAVVLPKAMPMEFPSNGGDLLGELQKAGMDEDQLLLNLAFAALFSKDDEPLYLICGLPMRRGPDGGEQLHIAVWTASASTAKSLRNVFPQGADTEVIRNLRNEMGEIIKDIIKLSDVVWAQVMEDRNEIVKRRDAGTELSWCAKKKVLVMGCGALGSWAAEIVARARPSSMHLIDNALVKPGILVRQNFTLRDIGQSKAHSLCNRISKIDSSINVTYDNCEVHEWLLANVEAFQKYDLVLDCTASSIFHMKLERDWWLLSQCSPPIVSIVIDAESKKSLCVIIERNAQGGIWDAYLGLKYRICTSGKTLDVVEAFYTPRAMDKLFQPEPGCSDPTFVGSAADVLHIVSSTINKSLEKIDSKKSTYGMLLSVANRLVPEQFNWLDLNDLIGVKLGRYRVRIDKKVFRKAKSIVHGEKTDGVETGGILWGFWDSAVQIIWIFDLSGPPADSKHSATSFVCGTKGTLAEHQKRINKTHGLVGFIGHWHTHPGMPPDQSEIDIASMAKLVSAVGHNQRRSMMLIFGREQGVPSAKIYIYESESLNDHGDVIAVESRQITLEYPVV